MRHLAIARRRHHPPARPVAEEVDDLLAKISHAEDENAVIGLAHALHSVHLTRLALSDLDDRVDRPPWSYPTQPLYGPIPSR
jgi:hypothetical protein